MWRILGYLLLFWFLYNLIFKFIIPIYRASRQMKQKFREMHDHMQQQASPGSAYSNAGAAPQSSSSGAKKSTGDYIDFEEVK